MGKREKERKKKEDRGKDNEKERERVGQVQGTGSPPSLLKGNNE
jgi:hypothetical protein